MKSLGAIGALVGLALAIGGRLLPFGFTVLLAFSRLDEAGRVLPFAGAARLPEYVEQLEIPTRLVDQWTIALTLFLVLLLVGRVVRPALARLGAWRWGVVMVALGVLCWSELLLVPLLQWAEGRCWLALPVRAALGFDPELLARSGTATTYLLIKGLAWLGLWCVLLPAEESEAKWLPTPVRLALACWWLTVWSLGGLQGNWGSEPVASELRPWQLSHLTRGLLLWPASALFGVLAWAFALPGIAGVVRAAQEGRIASTLKQSQSARPSIGALCVAGLLVLVLLQPLDLLLRVIGSSVSYPDLWDPIVQGYRFLGKNIGGVFATPPRCTPLVALIGFTLLRAGIETLFAALAALGIGALRGPGKGIAAFVLAAAAMVEALAPSIAVALDATSRQLTAYPAPPHLIGLPLAAIILLGMAGHWPSRIGGTQPALPALRLDPKAVGIVGCGLFIAGWQCVSPLLLALTTTLEGGTWPSLTLVQAFTPSPTGGAVLQLPQAAAYGLGWHLPLMLAALALTLLASSYTVRRAEAGGDATPPR